MRACFILALVFLTAGCGRSSSRVMLYCAQDREFAEQVFGEFTRQSGLSITPHFDTEANKSVSLSLELERDARRPRCDVHWNNEILWTIYLQKKGLLEPYESPAAEPYDAKWRAADRSWQAFAARARVLLVNTQLVKPEDWPRGIWDLAHPRFKGRAAMAKPQYGTTATHAACLFAALGDDDAKQFFRILKANDIQQVAGNKPVAVGVGQGKFAVGWTDTDDAIAEVDAGRPVTIIFPDADGIGTLFIPNTVAVVRDGPNPAGARKLVDYLLSPEIEKKLAEGASRQFPLNPTVQVELPPALAAGRTVKQMVVDFEKAADLWNDEQAFLGKEFILP
jgi:iron(III) transport system substrate-binding protein